MKQKEREIINKYTDKLLELFYADLTTSDLQGTIEATVSILITEARLLQIDHDIKTMEGGNL